MHRVAAVLVCALIAVPAAAARPLLGIKGNTDRFQSLTGQRSAVHHVIVGWNQGVTWGLPLVKLFLGLVGLIGAAGRAAARGVCMFIGPALLAGGIVALIQSVRVLGWNRADAVIYIILGSASILAALVTPMLTSYSERRVTAV